MKKVLLLAMLLLGEKGIATAQSLEQRIDSYFRVNPKAPQEVLVFGTNKSSDGYITGGYMLGRTGLYAGIPYNEKKILNSQQGSVSKDMRFGIIRQLQPNKLLMGFGAQPTEEGTKLHSFIGYNPLKSKDMKLWLIGNVTGSVFSFGLGLSYKVK